MMSERGKKEKKDEERGRKKTRLTKGEGGDEKVEGKRTSLGKNGNPKGETNPKSSTQNFQPLSAY